MFKLILNNHKSRKHGVGHKTFFTIFLLLYCGCVYAGHTASDTKLFRAYGGASVIYTNYELPDNSDLGIGLKGFAGVDIGRFFSVETAYLHNGESMSGGNYTVAQDSNINLNLVELSAMARIPTIKRLYMYGKIARMAWKATLEGCDSCGSERGRSQQNHTGFGLEYQFAQGSHMLVEYSKSSLNLFQTEMNLNVISLSVKLSMK